MCTEVIDTYSMVQIVAKYCTHILKSRRETYLMVNTEISSIMLQIMKL